jgi:predicted nucleic acid-binding protein
MAALVVDSSLASAWCFPDERTTCTNGVLEAVSSSVEGAPSRLWAYEVRNSVLMGMRRGRIGDADATAFLSSLNDLNIRLSDPVSYDDVFKLAVRYGLTFYDAAYLDVAIREGSHLASLDDAMCKAAVKAGIPLFETPRSTVYLKSLSI